MQGWKLAGTTLGLLSGIAGLWAFIEPSVKLPAKKWIENLLNREGIDAGKTEFSIAFLLSLPEPVGDRSIGSFPIHIKNFSTENLVIWSIDQLTSVESRDNVPQFSYAGGVTSKTPLLFDGLESGEVKIEILPPPSRDVCVTYLLIRYGILSASGENEKQNLTQEWSRSSVAVIPYLEYFPKNNKSTSADSIVKDVAEHNHDVMFRAFYGDLILGRETHLNPILEKSSLKVKSFVVPQRDHGENRVASNRERDTMHSNEEGEALRVIAERTSSGLKAVVDEEIPIFFDITDFQGIPGAATAPPRDAVPVRAEKRR